MGTIFLNCGCSRAVSMFPNDDTFDFHLCIKHLKEARRKNLTLDECRDFITTLIKRDLKRKKK